MTAFIQFKPIRTQQQLKERVSHIVKEQNRFKGVINNLIFVNKEFSTESPTKPASIKDNNLKRSTFTRKRGSYKSQLKKQQANLRKAQFIGDKKAIKRAEGAIKRNQAKLAELLEQREALNDGRNKNGGGNKILYREIVFSITGVRHLLEDEQYANKLYSLSTEFLKENISAKIIKNVLHRDQPGQIPHLHVLLEYDSENSFTQDMKKKYEDDEKHIQDLGIEWERKIKKSGIIEQFHIDYEDIVENGKKEYTSLAKYKKQQKETLLQVTEEATKETQKLKSEIIQKNKDKKGNIDKSKVLSALLSTVKTVKIELKLLIASLGTNKLLKKNNRLNSMVEKLQSELERKDRLSDELYQANTKDFDKRVRTKNTAVNRAEHKLSILEKKHEVLERVNKENMEKSVKLTLSNQELQAKTKSLESQLSIMKRAKIKIGATLKKLRFKDEESKMSLIDIIDKQ